MYWEPQQTAAAMDSCLRSAWVPGKTRTHCDRRTVSYDVARQWHYTATLLRAARTQGMLLKIFRNITFACPWHTVYVGHKCCVRGKTSQHLGNMLATARMLPPGVSSFCRGLARPHQHDIVGHNACTLPGNTLRAEHKSLFAPYACKTALLHKARQNGAYAESANRKGRRASCVRLHMYPYEFLHEGLMCLAINYISRRAQRASRIRQIHAWTDSSF